jgi:peptidoglycan hydrolase CwlO-like protein
LWLVGKAIPVSDQVLEVATPADVQKLQADLDEANGKVESLTAKRKLQADLDEAQKQIDELKKRRNNHG